MNKFYYYFSFLEKCVTSTDVKEIIKSGDGDMNRKCKIILIPYINYW